MARVKRIQSNFSKGELSPRLYGRPDLAAYFNGCSVLENYLIYPQGGVYRAPGTRFVAIAKYSDHIVRLIPFIVSRTEAYVLEFGHQYFRVYYQGAQVPAVDITTPYTEDELFDLQCVQLADVLFIDHSNHQTGKVSLAGSVWSFGYQQYRPPPSFENVTDLNETLTPGATTGTGITFTAGSGVFLPGDVDRQILFDTSRAIITSVTDASNVVADILQDFPNTNPIAAGAWFLDKSPSSALKPNKKGPINGPITLIAQVSSTDTTHKSCFRAEDVGKFIKLLGGEVEITSVPNGFTAQGIIRATLVKAVFIGTSTTNITPTEGGDWTLEVRSWDDTHGWPISPFFYQGRLGHVGTKSQPTTWWLSASDDYENYAVGALADLALQYTIASEQLNTLRWAVDIGNLYIGTAGTIFSAKGSGLDQPLGGDNIPFVRAQDSVGSLFARPVVFGNTGFFIDSSGMQVYELAFDLSINAFRATDITRHAEHITRSGLKQENIAWQRVPNRHMYFIRKDGQLAVLTYFRTPEDVVGWSRRTTDGEFVSQCVIPHPDGDRDQIWFTVKRGGNYYIEYVEDNAAEAVASSRPWTSAQTDSSVFFTSVTATDTVTGLDHLEGKVVAAIADGSYKGTFVVTGGAITLQEPHFCVEVGLTYGSTLTTMPMAVQDSVVDDQKISWIEARVRFKDSIGGQLNGEDFLFNLGGQPLDASPPMFSGKKQIYVGGISEEGKITVSQPFPFPQEILSITGRISVGD